MSRGLEMASNSKWRRGRSRAARRAARVRVDGNLNHIGARSCDEIFRVVDAVHFGAGHQSAAIDVEKQRVAAGRGAPLSVERHQTIDRRAPPYRAIEP